VGSAPAEGLFRVGHQVTFGVRDTSAASAQTAIEKGHTSVITSKAAK
jgi:hypothetical protein